MVANNTTASLDLRELFRNPDFFFWQFDNSQAVFARMTRGTYHDSIFCDRRIVPAHQELATIDLGHLLRAHGGLDLEPPQLCYIFHVAHCGSTLLARALDIKEKNLVCREPVPLRQLALESVATGHEDTPPTQWSARLRLTLSLLGRRYDNSGPVIVKANVPVNFVIPQLMRTSPMTRAVLLYSTLDNYLLAVLKSPDHQQWVQLVFEQLNPAISRLTGIERGELSRLEPAEMAACLWAVQMIIFAAVSREFRNTRSLDSEALFTTPLEVLSNCFGFFGQQVEDSRISRIVSGDLFRNYAKSREPRGYDQARWLRERAVTRQSLNREIGNARAWIDAHVTTLGIAERLPNPLMGTAPSLLKESDYSEPSG